MASQLLDAASTAIEVAVDAQADDIGIIPEAFKHVCIAIVCREFANPLGLESKSEALGAYSHTDRFSTTENVALTLTKGETSFVRKALHGTNLASVRTPSSAEELLEDLAPETST